MNGSADVTLDNRVLLVLFVAILLIALFGPSQFGIRLTKTSDKAFGRAMKLGDNASLVVSKHQVSPGLFKYSLMPFLRFDLLDLTLWQARWTLMKRPLVDWSKRAARRLMPLVKYIPPGMINYFHRFQASRFYQVTRHYLVRTLHRIRDWEHRGAVRLINALRSVPRRVHNMRAAIKHRWPLAALFDTGWYHSSIHGSLANVQTLDLNFIWQSVKQTTVDLSTRLVHDGDQILTSDWPSSAQVKSHIKNIDWSKTAKRYKQAANQAYDTANHVYHGAQRSMSELANRVGDSWRGRAGILAGRIKEVHKDFLIKAQEFDRGQAESAAT